MDPSWDRQEIATCRQHHRVLRELLAQFPTSERFLAEDAQASLKRFAVVLSRHLAFEDEHLYPKLARSTSAEVAATAQRYRAEMGDLRGNFMAFVENWSAPGAIESAKGDYFSDWLNIREALVRRIEAEDGHLYEVAEKALGA